MQNQKKNKHGSVVQETIVFSNKQCHWKDLTLYAYKATGIVVSALQFSVLCVFQSTKSVSEEIILTLLYCCAYMLLGKIYGAFHLGQERVSNLIFSKGISLLLVYGGMFFICWGLNKRAPLLMLWVIVYIATVCAAAVWTIIGNRLFLFLYPPVRAMIVYQDKQKLDTVQKMYNPKLFSVERIVHITELGDSLSALDGVEALFLCDVPTKLRNVILKYSSFHSIQVYLRPRIGDVLLSGARHLHMSNLPVLYYRPNKSSLGYEAGKRALDIAVSVSLLILTAPIMLCTVYFIKIYDGGPALYRQIRLTKNGKMFSVLKFRSMCVDAERDKGAQLSSVGDDRITPFGRLIRATRIDELPQLVNIIKGEMSLVGPRPERPEIAAQYVQKLPEFQLRLQVKAGLTGYAQVYGKYSTAPYDKLQMDLIYIANQSFLEDIKIILTTIKIMFIKESTQGIEPGQITAGEV